MNQRRKFKLVILGDEKVGKTSFIQRLMQSNLTDQREKLPPVYLPNEMFQNDCVTIIFDTEYVPGQIPDEVKDADIIILMYDITNSDTADRLKGFWLKKLDELDIKKPIIIVGNKIDKVDDLEDQDIEPQRIFRVIKPLVKDYNRVEMGIECSALTKRGLNDVINCAQRSFLYPLAPIYSFGRRQITDQFKKALTRIFRICDKDGDNLWNDQELIRFQKKVFRRQLDSQDILGIKGMISEELKVDQIEYITLEGFIALQKRGVELMKIQICWTILRHFHYNDDLQIEDQEFQNEILIDKDSGQTIELSESALQFIDRLYKHREKEIISKFDIEQILYPATFEHHLPVDNLHGPLNRDGWIALWNAYVYKNYKEAYKLLKYIGYDGKLHHCFKETARKDNWNSLSKFSDRKTFGISIVVHQKDKYAKLFHDKYQLIVPFKNKTYIFDLMGVREAETQSDFIGTVDLFIVEEGLLFQYEKIIPFLQFRLGVDINQIIHLASTALSNTPFGYNEGQIILLKQQNGISATLVVSLMILGLSAAFGTKFILNRIKSK